MLTYLTYLSSTLRFNLEEIIKCVCGTLVSWYVITNQYIKEFFSSTYGVNSNLKQECIQVTCVPSAAVAVCWRGGGLLPGVLFPGGSAPEGRVIAPGGGGVVSQHALRQNPRLWTDRQV